MNGRAEGERTSENEALRRALVDHGTALAEISDPAEAASNATEAIDLLALHQRHAAAVRAEAIAAWRAAGASYSTIAVGTGLSVTRVAQLVHTPVSWADLSQK